LRLSEEVKDLLKNKGGTQRTLEKTFRLEEFVEKYAKLETAALNSRGIHRISVLYTEEIRSNSPRGDALARSFSPDRARLSKYQPLFAASVVASCRG
jgi:hypothetical protein